MRYDSCSFIFIIYIRILCCKLPVHMQSARRTGIGGFS